MRPPRNPPDKPVMPGTVSDLADAVRCLQMIYAGALADGRALRGCDGVYTVNVVPPLELTDDGIVLNVEDPQFAATVTAGASLPAGQANDLLYHDGTQWTALAMGDDRTVLTVCGGQVAWEPGLPEGQGNDVLYHDGTQWAALAMGDDRTVLTVCGGQVAWEPGLPEGQVNDLLYHDGAQWRALPASGDDMVLSMRGGQLEWSMLLPSGGVAAVLVWDGGTGWTTQEAPQDGGALVANGSAVEWAASAAPYQVLQRREDGTVGFDWVRVHA